VLAARLREGAACRVVLLEAGQDLAGLADAPPDVLDASVPTLAHDWGYLAEPSPLGRRATLPPARGELVRPAGSMASRAIARRTSVSSEGSRSA